MRSNSSHSISSMQFLTHAKGGAADAPSPLHLELERLRVEHERVKAALAREEDRRFVLGQRSVLAALGARIAEAPDRPILRGYSVIAGIMGAILSGTTRRDEIVCDVAHRLATSYRQVGFLLNHLGGDDPLQDLWFKGEDGEYRLHLAAPADLKRAA